MSLPVLISIPHGGMRIPPEIAELVRLSRRDLFDDIDPYTREIYDIGSVAAAAVSTDIARTFLDLNRAPDDRPPQNSDGVVKTRTCYEHPIYHDGQQLTTTLAERLIARYHRPYHDELERAASKPEVRLGLDCHSMARFPPAVAPDTHEERPLFCLSNADGATCPTDLLEALARAVTSAFDCDPDAVRLNHPFKGGYITRRHGLRPIPWIQVEMSRAWYLDDPWFDPNALTVAEARLAELRDRFQLALSSLPI